MTPCFSHNFPQMQTKQCTTSRLFNLGTLLIMQLFYLRDVSMCKLSHRRRCLYATCDIISYVLSRLPCFQANVLTTRRVRVHVRALKDGYLHTFWLTKTYLCVTFNICQHVCHNRNDVQPHDITYEPFSICNFSRTKSCLRKLVWPTRRTVMRVHCEKTSLHATFWFTWTCPHAHFLIAGRVCIQLVT